MIQKVENLGYEKVYLQCNPQMQLYIIHILIALMNNMSKNVPNRK